MKVMQLKLLELDPHSCQLGKAIFRGLTKIVKNLLNIYLEQENIEHRDEFNVLVYVMRLIWKCQTLSQFTPEAWESFRVGKYVSLKRFSYNWMSEDEVGTSLKYPNKGFLILDALLMQYLLNAANYVFRLNLAPNSSLIAPCRKQLSAKGI